MRILNITVPVSIPDDMDADEAVGILNKMIDIGYADACESARDPDLDKECIDEAVRAKSVSIDQPFCYDDDLEDCFGDESLGGAE